MKPRTPMLQQYFSAKEEHPGVLLAMRVGDFYEFYGEDAETAANTLEITLTGREDGENGRVAMAGVPYHSVEKYLARLVAKGFKVALCEQLESAKAKQSLIKRGVTRVITPGTVIEEAMLPGPGGNFLAAICVQDGKAGLATIDPSTGEFAVTEISGPEMQERLLAELSRIHPSELLVSPNASAYADVAKEGLGSAITERPAIRLERASEKLREQLNVANLKGFGCDDKPCAIVAAGMILAYAESIHLPLQHVDSMKTYDVEGFMRLDAATRRSLEISSNMADRGRSMTLLSVVDATVTSMGGRLIKQWLDQPLLDRIAIQSRQAAIERFVNHSMARADLRELLKRLGDMERLVGRASTGAASPRDLIALRASLHALPFLDDPLRLVGLGRIQELREGLGNHAQLFELLEKALVADPPLALREGGVIKLGYDVELDKLRDLGSNGKNYIASLETAEREKTGLNQLKVGFNSVFGYYLEVPKAHIERVPEHYIRKQTTASAERYITAELKEHESLVLGAEEKAIALEAELFRKVRERVAAVGPALLATARAIAELDVYAALAETAVRKSYVKPVIAEDDVMEIIGGRHPVVEMAGMNFVPNDIQMPESDHRVHIITGPNMAGKSTFLRQIALITLLAQVGSFVPAKSCRLGICDRIFARIGARDELATGQSTFMVEMVESANILNHATSQSLVILDEVGRGTSTYDGLAIAWAMVEHLVRVGAKTLFATHYHQLNALADQSTGVANYRVAVEEVGEGIVWTHRVLPGGTDRSYGIHVARMAGMPVQVLSRAAAVLADLEERAEPPKAISTDRLQLTLFEAEAPPVLRALQALNVDGLTPIQALQLLDSWKKQFAKRDSS